MKREASRLIESRGSSFFFILSSIFHSNSKGCNDLKGIPSVDHAIFTRITGPACDSGLWDSGEDGRTQIFKQGSCVPDDKGQCPTSIMVSKTETKLWIKCGQGCWTKRIFHEEDQVLEH